MSQDSMHLEVDGLHEPWRVAAVSGEERLHAPFVFHVTVGYRDPPATPVDPEAIVGQKATLHLSLADGSERLIHGAVRALEARHAGYLVTVEPRLGLLADTVDHVVFTAQDPVAIAQAVLGEHQVDVKSDVLRTIPPREQCVQAFETDLDFVRRILAEEGVTFRFDHDGKDQVVLVDDPLRCPDVEGLGKIPFSDEEGMAGRECVYRLALRRELVSDGTKLRDYDFEHPAVKLEGQQKAGSRGLERYEFPGGFKDPAVGADLARIRLEEAQQRKLRLHGLSSSRRLTAGRVIHVTGAPRAEMNARWLITEVRHEATETGGSTGAPGARYVATFTAIPADRAYRPERLPVARLGGVQTSTVTGPAGAEIHTDDHGRMAMLFRHERRRAADEKSSHWMRSIQPPTGGGVMLPRMGWEVLVGFYGASGDMPFEIGRLYNGASKPPEGLPGAAVVSTVGTATTPGGGGGNVLRTNDAAGGESMDLTASRDMSELVANDRAVFVTGLEKIDIGAQHLFSVGQRLGMNIVGALSHTIAAKHELSAGTNHEFNASTEIVGVGGARMFKVGGDYKATTTLMLRLVGQAKGVAAIEKVTRNVTGKTTQIVGAIWTQFSGLGAGVSVLGGAVEEFGAAKVIRAKAYKLATRKLTETYAFRDVTGGEIKDEFHADTSYTIGGEAEISAPEVKMTGHCKITIKGSGATIVIEPSKVSMTGKFEGHAPCIEIGDQGQV